MDGDQANDFTMIEAGSRRDGGKGRGKSKGRGGGKHRHARDAESPHVQISKACSYILRHGAEKEGLIMRSDGYIKVSDLLARPRLAKLGCDFEQLQQVVDTNEKKRFTLLFEPSVAGASSAEGDRPLAATSGGAEGIWWIRANQGHTLQVEDLELEEAVSADDIPLAIHGTNMQAWNSIQKEGLSRMKRNHVHMAKGLSDDPTVVSGMRSTATVFIYVDVEAAVAEGIKFFVSSNGAILSPGDEQGFIPPRLFKRVIGRISGKLNVWSDRKWVAIEENA